MNNNFYSILTANEAIFIKEINFHKYYEFPIFHNIIEWSSWDADKKYLFSRNYNYITTPMEPNNIFNSYPF